MCVRGGDRSSGCVPSVPSRRLPQGRNSAAKCWMSDAFCRLEASLAPQHDSGQDLRGKDHLRAQPVRKESFTTGQACREIFGAPPARNFGDRMRDPPDSRTRCQSSVQHVRPSQIRSAPFGASVPTDPSASQRIQLAPRSSAFVWELVQADSPCSCPRVPRQVPQPSSLTPCPILAASFAEVPSPKPIGSTSGVRTQQVCHHHVPGHCQQLPEARSPKDLFSAGQRINGLTTTLTLTTLFVPAAIWLSLRHSQSGSAMAQKEEELSRHTGRASKRQRVGRYFSRCSDPKKSWFRRRGPHVHASVSSASC